MQEMSYVKRSIITAVCIALCVVLPMAFHSVQNAGSIFCPMHIPVLLCGLICGWPFGLLCGLAGPILSSLLTSMPTIAYLPSMMVELAIYGFVTGLMMQLIHTNNTHFDLYASLVTAMLVGRFIAGATKALIFAAGDYSVAVWVTAYFVTSFPGIVIQIVLIPTIYFSLMRARLISSRCPGEVFNG